MGLSAVLIVKNEEKNIEACLKTLGFADEIVVVDSGSSDRTIELAKLAGTSKVVSRKFDNFAAQKNYAVGLAAQDWILSIDADERVGGDLQKEILDIIHQKGTMEAYAVHRRTNLFGRDFKAGGLQDDAPVRLFRRGKAVFENPVHEALKVDGRTGRLKSELYHVSFQTVRGHLARLQFYTGVEAENQKESLKISVFGHFFIRPFYRFFSIYVLKQGFCDGIEGFFYALLSGYYEWVRWMKIWEKGKSREGA